MATLLTIYIVVFAGALFFRKVLPAVGVFLFKAVLFPAIPFMVAAKMRETDRRRSNRILLNTSLAYIGVALFFFLMTTY